MIKGTFKFYIVLLGLIFVACEEDLVLDPAVIADAVEDHVIENPGNIQEVATLPPMPNYPGNNLHSQAKEDLSRLLFWDPVLSGTMDISCGTCHHPNFGYADGLERSIGVGGNGIGPNRTGTNLIDTNFPTLLNTAFNGMTFLENYNPAAAPMFWDNRNSVLEEQSIMPLLSALEMRGNQISEEEIIPIVIERLEAIPEYVSLFESAFGSEGISENRIVLAISTFERSLITTNSRFDRYMRGDANILTQQELNGLNDFIDVECADCHSGAMFSDFDLHTLSVPNNRINDAGATGNYDFRTPSLRNVSLTAPYMHNGVFDSLEDVLEFYDSISRGNGNSQNSNVNDNQIAIEARDLNLNNNQINDIIAFLQTLTDTDFDKTIPTSVPSNMQVGG